MKSWLTFLLLFGWGLITVAQPGPPPEIEEAENLFKLGLDYYSREDYLSAAQTFEIAAEKPFNRKTTANMYMAGLSWFQEEEPNKAKLWFSKLMKEYPASKYADEAQFHRAQLLLEEEDNSLRELGLDMLFRLSDRSKDFSLRNDALGVAKHYLFEEFDTKFVNVYYLFVNDKFQVHVLEAICHHLAGKGKDKQIRQMNEKIDEYIEAGGKPTRYLMAMKKEHGGGNGSTGMLDELNIAMFMPFYLQLSDTATSMPAKSARAVDLYVGMKLALDSLSKTYGKRINVRVFDSRKDTFRVKEQLSELESFFPDLIIGDISSSTNKPLVRWSEQNAVAQFILLNPNDDLIDQREHVFLTHPSIKTHGKKMAEYCFDSLRFKKMAAFYDNGPISSAMYGAFEARFEELGGTIIKRPLSGNFEMDKDALKDKVKGLKYQSFDGIYAPLSSEEHAGLTISLLNYHDIETRVFGSPDWEYFEAIDGELKSRFNLTFSTSYFEQNDSLGYEELEDYHIQRFENFPTRYVVQGYDIMNYLLQVAKGINPFQSVGDLYREAEKKHMIHQDVFYEGEQSNQHVNIVQFKDGRILKVN